MGIALVAQWEQAEPIVATSLPVRGIERLVVPMDTGSLAVQASREQTSEPGQRGEPASRPSRVGEPTRSVPAAGTQPADHPPHAERRNGDKNQEG